MDLATQRLMQAAAGAGGDKLYIDNVFNTDVYRGNAASTRNITNGIDLSTEGGLVWYKSRSQGQGHRLVDTERGATKVLESYDNNAEATETTGLKAFLTNGFTIGSEDNINQDGEKHVAWTFRRAPKFFDVVTYTGNGQNNRQIAHNLGCTVGAIFVKQRSNTNDWAVYHRGNTKNSGGSAVDPESQRLTWNSTSSTTTETTFWANTAPTSSVFYVGTSSETNDNNQPYVAYIFAHNNNDGDYGESGADVIKCGSYTGNGSSSGPLVNLGFEPQWVMVKGGSTGGLWLMADCMRGVFHNSDDPYLAADNANAEYTTYTWMRFDPEGFQLRNTGQSLNTNGQHYTYIAIRRPDAAVGTPAEVGTDVFTMDWGNGSANGPAFDSNFTVDFTFSKQTASVGYWITTLRPLKKWLKLNTTASAGALTSYERYDFNKGVHQQYDSSNLAYMWKRHTGFDIVTYDGRQGGATVMNLKHNLGVVPEMMWIRKVNNNGMWSIYHKGTNGGIAPEGFLMQIDTNGQEDQPTFLNDTAPTATQFTVGSMSAVNDSGDHYIALLYASVEGISKVGYYTGNGVANRQITTGFQPRFILVKRTDAGTSSDWLLCDSFRGVDKNLFINTTAASSGGQRVSTNSTAFVIMSLGVSSINANNEKYIYYCHA